MDEEMQRPVIVRRDCVKEMVSATQITQASFIGPKGIRNSVPSCQVKFFRQQRRPHEPHSTSAVRDSKLPPVCLSSQNSSAGRERRLTWAGIGQENDLLGLKIMREPGMKFS